MTKPLDQSSRADSPPKSSPKARASKGSDRPSGLWSWLTFLGLLVLVFYLLAAWYRWLRPDPEFLGFASAVAGLLAIASLLGLQSEAGRGLTLRLDESRFLSGLIKVPWRACLISWLAAGLAAAFLHLGSPVAAERFRLRGVTALEGGRYSEAIRSFRQAISLDPRNAGAHYNLALTYEALNEAEGAIPEYQAALELNDEFWPTYNNLGRLYLKSRSDPEAALAVLESGRHKADSDLARAVIAKNIGWAYLEMVLPLSALASLDEAMSALNGLQTEGQGVGIYLAEVYRLQALTYRLWGNRAEERSAWQGCLGYALAVAESPDCAPGGARLPADCVDARRWAAEAKEYLQAPKEGEGE